MAIAPKAGDGKIYRWVQLIAITIVTAALVLLIFEATTLLKMGTTANGVVFSIGVVGLAGFVALPWVRVFEAMKQKSCRITAIVFLSLIGVCAILWIVSVWMIVGLVAKSIKGGLDDQTLFKSLNNSLQIIRISVIISIQFIVASYIAKNIIKYGKTLLPYQVMSAVAQLYLDFYLILVALAVNITPEGVEFSKTALLLKNMWFHALLVVAIVIGIFPNTVFMRVDRRKMINARGTVYDTPTEVDLAASVEANPSPVTPATTPVIDPFAPDAPPPSALDTVDDKLRKIKELLDRGLITQEEYDKKREDIINSI